MGLQTKGPVVKAFFDKRTSSLQYVVSDPATKKCAVIDPVLDYDEKSGSTSTKSAEALISYIEKQDFDLEWILDTHPHADHLSAAKYIKDRTGRPTATSGHVTEVQKLWKVIYNWPELCVDGSQWDRLFADDETFKIGSQQCRVLFSPGHTLASITYIIGDAAFIHDTLFMPDGGTARADFPGGSAKQLWQTIEHILALPVDTRLFTGHDYQPHGRKPAWESTVAQQKAHNIHLKKTSDEKSFVAFREKKDKALPMPKLILHALQVNINGGALPPADANGRRYLKIPLDALGDVPWEEANE